MTWINLDISHNFSILFSLGLRTNIELKNLINSVYYGDQGVDNICYKWNLAEVRARLFFFNGNYSEISHTIHKLCKMPHTIKSAQTIHELSNFKSNTASIKTYGIYSLIESVCGLCGNAWMWWNASVNPLPFILCGPTRRRQLAIIYTPTPPRKCKKNDVAGQTLLYRLQSMLTLEWYKNRDNSDFHWNTLCKCWSWI